MKPINDGSPQFPPHAVGVSGPLVGSIRWPGPGACLLVYDPDGTGQFATLPDRIPVEEAALLASMTRNDGLVLIREGVLPVAGESGGNVQKECPVLALADVLGRRHWLDLATRVLAAKRRGGGGASPRHGLPHPK